MEKEKFIKVHKTLGTLNILILLVAGVVLFGWMFNITLFKSILPSFYPMNPLSAFLFLLSGSALFFINTKNPKIKPQIGIWIASVIILVAAVRIVGFLGFDVEIDRILFTGKLGSSRMVLDTTVSFLLVGLSLFFIEKRKTLLIPSQIFATIVFLISFFTIIGYVYAPSSLNKVTTQVPMAVHTAVTFLLLSVAILLSRYQEGFVSVIMHRNIGGAIFRQLLSIAIVLPIVVALIRYSEEKADLSRYSFGTPSLTICLIAITFFLIWILARKLNRVDEKRKLGFSELTKLKNDFADSEIKYRNLVNNAGVMMYTISLDGKISFVSNKTCEVSGYSSSQLLGLPFTKFISQDCISEVIKYHRRQVNNLIKEFTLKFKIKTSSNKYKWIEQTTVLLFDNDKVLGFQCIAKDISETKAMEEILKKYENELIVNQERLQSILDNAASMIYIKDLDGKYVLTNKKFKSFYNINDNQVVGGTDFDFENLVQAQRFKDTDLQVLATGNPVELEEIIETVNGKFNMFIVKFPLLDAMGKINGISGIATDITQRAKYREELIHAKKIAEDAKKMQEQFLANMSHEIRTPMNGILGMTSLLLETKLTDEQTDFAKTIKKSSDNLLVIINDILDFSKITAGKLTIEQIDFNLLEVLENIKAIFSHKIKSKGLALKINTADSVPTVLNGDPYRLNQILVNLVGNAIKFTQQGIITVNISMANTSSDKNILNFEVQDTGIGINTDKLNDIFESFTQGSIETSRKYGGTGLGLAITKQLVELQDGNISVESKINSGTTFKFSIPYSNKVSTKTVFFVGDDLKNYKTIFKGKKFLVAEDNEINQKVIRQVILKAGGSVDIANNGLEAVKMLKINNDYHLIIMDLQMPEMDGYAATKYIRNVMQLSIPIVAMTASALKDEKAKCIQMGMDDYLSKPFNFSFIYKRLNALLNENSNEAVAPPEEESTSNLLFDLSMLEEMDDDEYVEEILSLFLETMPIELNALTVAIAANELNEVYVIAHKIKSSVGLLKARVLLNTITEIETKARNGEANGLDELLTIASKAFNNIEMPLKARLNILTKIA